MYAPPPLAATKRASARLVSGKRQVPAQRPPVAHSRATTPSSIADANVARLSSSRFSVDPLVSALPGARCRRRRRVLRPVLGVAQRLDLLSRKVSLARVHPVTPPGGVVPGLAAP